MKDAYGEEISGNLDEIRKVLEAILQEMRRRNTREERKA